MRGALRLHVDFLLHVRVRLRDGERLRRRGLLCRLTLREEAVDYLRDVVAADRLASGRDPGAGASSPLQRVAAKMNVSHW